MSADLVLTAVNSIAVAVAAYYGYRNHAIGTSNAAKIDNLTANTPPKGTP